MDADRTTARVVGVLFIAATVASILGSVVLGSTLDGPDYLTGVADHETGVIVAALLFLVAAASAFATAVLLFPILRRHAEGLAVGYVGLRGFENIFYVAGVIALLMMLTVSQDDASNVAATTVPLVGAALLALHTWSVLIGTLIFASLGSLTLNSILYRARLVPRWLSGWGLAGAPLVFLYGLLGIVGVDTAIGSPYMLLAMPTAVQEMVFAGWLITKGLDRPTVKPHQQSGVRAAAMS